MLEERGYRVIAAHSGEQALERALAERPDAILLDLLMPGMSGWETAAALAQHPETRDMPIVDPERALAQAEAEAAGAAVRRLDREAARRSGAVRGARARGRPAAASRSRC